MASVLVVAPAWVGDMVMAQSLVAELKRRMGLAIQKRPPDPKAVW